MIVEGHHESYKVINDFSERIWSTLSIYRYDISEYNILAGARKIDDFQRKIPGGGNSETQGAQKIQSDEEIWSLHPAAR